MWALTPFKWTTPWATIVVPPHLYPSGVLAAWVLCEFPRGSPAHKVLVADLRRLDAWAVTPDRVSVTERDGYTAVLERLSPKRTRELAHLKQLTGQMRFARNPDYDRFCFAPPQPQP